MSLALLVHSGDNNSWVWPHWYKFWKKNMGPELKTYFSCEDKDPGFPGVIPIKTGQKKWGQSLQDSLAQISESHIIYHHEDYFIIDPADIKFLRRLKQLMDRYSMDIMKCCGDWMGYDDQQNPPKKEEIEGLSLWRYNNNSPYLVSHQSSIWKKQILFDSVKCNESPWQHEMDGTERMRKRNLRIYAFRGRPPIPYQEAVNHGVMRPEAIHLFGGSE
jgi:hypothetical protein